MKVTRLLATVGAVVLAGSVSFATTPAGAAAPGAHGKGSGVYLHPPFTGDRVSLDLDASASGGHFAIVHYDKLGKIFSELSGTVDCVAVNGRTAVTTGTITKGHAPELAGDVRGKAYAITIVDNDGPDAVGVSYPLDQIQPCSAWPINMVMDRGSYSIG
jgi:hypothetical protein